jgi:hypoxanthine phosphoribosyltransferase
VSTQKYTEFKRRIPEQFSEVYPAAKIQERIASMASEIGDWCQGVWLDSHTDVLVLPVLRGGIFFFADLAKGIDTSIEIAPIRAQSYESGKNGVPKGEVSIELGQLAVKGRVVLIVDDVCDSGKTLEALEKQLLEMGAREVRSVVLVRRLLDTPSFVPCWVGFQYDGPEWFVGFGMDDNERWRNLPSIYVVKRGD